MRSFHIFNLPWTYLLSPFIGPVASFLNSCDSTSFQMFLYWVRHPLWCLRNIKCHCVGGVLVILSYAIAKYFFGCLDKQWYNCFPVYLIAHNIPPVFSIIAWHLIRKHHLVYIDCRYVSYLSLLVKVFRCNLYLTKFEYLLFINRFLCSAYQMVKNNYFHSFSVSSFFVFRNTPVPPSWSMPINTD